LRKLVQGLEVLQHPIRHDHAAIPAEAIQVGMHISAQSAIHAQLRAQLPVDEFSRRHQLLHRIEGIEGLLNVQALTS